jgi:anti-sigma factor RsiW
MTCQELIDFLRAYLDGELPAETRSNFEAHLALCPECRAYLNTYRATVALSKSAYAHEPAPSEPPRPVPDELIQAILAAGQAQQSD